MYQVDLAPIAEDQLAELPEEALGPFEELLTVLGLVPWSGRPFDPENPKANLLTHVFGRRGIAAYLVLEEQREVHVFRITWT